MKKTGAIKITPEQFGKLPPKTRVRMVAQDVIGQIALEEYRVKRGNYVEATEPMNSYKGSDDLTPQIIKRAKCEVCAKGAMFLSCIRLGDDAKVRDLTKEFGGSRSNNLHVTRKIRTMLPLSHKQLDLIEIAFESGAPDWNSKSHDWPEYNAAKTFGNEHGNSDRRLVAIMANILRHDGKFVPSDSVTNDEIDKALKEALVIKPIRKKKPKR